MGGASECNYCPPTINITANLINVLALTPFYLGLVLTSSTSPFEVESGSGLSHERHAGILIPEVIQRTFPFSGIERKRLALVDMGCGRA